MILITSFLLCRVLSNIAYGQLRIETPSHSYVFPPFPSSADDGHPRAHIRVLKHNFWLRLALMSDLGFSEAYMFGEIECDNLIDIFSVCRGLPLSHLILDDRTMALRRIPLLPPSDSIHYETDHWVYHPFLDAFRPPSDACARTD